MTVSSISLNCDMGESYGLWRMGNDQHVMPHIDLTNIACGFHASDPHIMAQTLGLASKHQVKVGAHPGYPDLQGFGRRSMTMEHTELSHILIYQIGALSALAHSQGLSLNHVKPHGALYNDMQRDLGLFEAVCQAVAHFHLPLMTLATPNRDPFLDCADRYDVPLLFEAFIDRAYLASGTLAPRAQPGAVLSDPDAILDQANQIIRYQKVKTLDGEILPIDADTLCIHGDNPSSILIAQRLRQIIDQQGSQG